MSRLRVIPRECDRVDYDCVRVLATAYRRALRGEFQAVALATVREGGRESGGAFGTAWSEPERVNELAGAVSYLSHRFMQEAIYEL